MDLLPRRVWSGAVKSKVVKLSRWKINRTLHRVMKLNKGNVIVQPEFVSASSTSSKVIGCISLLGIVIFIWPIWLMESRLFSPDEGG